MPVSQAFNVGAKMRFVLELRIDIFLQLFFKKCYSMPGQKLQVG